MEDKLSQTSFNIGNKFYILGEFTDELLKEIVVPLTQKIEELAQRKEAVIDIYINSNGGYAHIANHIIKLIEIAKHKGIKVRTIVMARAYSAGSMVAITGTPGERYIDPYAEHLPHYGTFWGHAKHTPRQLDRETAYHKRYLANMLEHYNKYSQVPELDKHIEDDLYFLPAKLCIKYKLADKYIEEM